MAKHKATMTNGVWNNATERVCIVLFLRCKVCGEDRAKYISDTENSMEIYLGSNKSKEV